MCNIVIQQYITTLKRQYCKGGGQLRGVYKTIYTIGINNFLF